MYDNNDSSSNYWLNYIIFNNSKKLNKNFFNFFKNKKIEIRKIWTLNSDGNFYKKYPKMNLEVSKYLSKRIICLPSGVFK